MTPDLCDRLYGYWYALAMRYARAMPGQAGHARWCIACRHLDALFYGV